VHVNSELAVIVIVCQASVNVIGRQTPCCSDNKER